MATSSFDSAKRLCRWANDEIANFQAAEAAFLSDDPYKVIAVDNFFSGIYVSKLIKVVDVKQPGDEIERAAYRIVGDLRNVLDQSISAASEAIGSNSRKHTNFPFSLTEADFNRRLAAEKGMYRGIPVQLHPKIHSFSPFLTKEDGTEGDKLLCFLNEIANSNKHQVTLETIFSPQRIGIGTIQGFDVRFGVEKKTETEFNLLWAYPRAPNAKIGVNVTAELRVANASPLADKPALDLLKEFHTLVERLILEIEEETAKLLSP